MNRDTTHDDAGERKKPHVDPTRRRMAPEAPSTANVEGGLKDSLSARGPRCRGEIEHPITTMPSGPRPGAAGQPKRSTCSR